MMHPAPGPTAVSRLKRLLPGRPLLSVIVVFFDMEREAPRTLYSLSRAYQRDLDGIEYEVIALDHGSAKPLSPSLVHGFGREFRLQRIDTDNPSPVLAINDAVSRARGRHVMINIDGARILSPGLLGWTARAFGLYTDAFVHTLAWHLGRGVQNETLLDGYDQGAEDRLLDECGWRRDGYRLFDVSVLALSSAGGFFSDLHESNCFALPRRRFLAMGGLHPGFRLPGGGIANLDFYRRAMSDPQQTPVRILGEGTFHQIHGGVATNVPLTEHPFERYQQEYQGIYGRPWEALSGQAPVLLGRVPSAAARFLLPETGI